MSDLINTQLGQYQLTAVIRRGGMSTVYKAYQASLDRFVAVKVLFHNRDPQFAARFKREARAIAQLQHPNILPVYDYGEQDFMLYLVLQYIENGVTLADMLGQPLAPIPTLRLAISLLSSLDYAHKRSIIHRDIKPANVLMPSPTWPMLADFGIAKLLNDNELRLTVPGLIVGTAAYMAPEQATGRPVDARTDIYATGVVLYEMFTGRVPFDADTPMAVLTKHAYEAPPPPRTFNPDLPPLVEAVLLRAMAKDPDARYQNATEMAQDLERVIGQLGQPQSRNQLTGMYQLGVQAFREGRWNMAVEQLSQLVTIDPEYEDAIELLEAAREAQERAKAEARQQIEIVRQRRQSGPHQRLPTSEVPAPAPFNPHATHRLPPLADMLAAQSAADVSREPANAGTGSTPAPQPEAQRGSATGKLEDLDSPRRKIPWLYIGIAVIAVLVLVFLATRIFASGAGQPDGAPTPVGAATTGPVAAGTAAPERDSTPAPEPDGTLIFTDSFDSGLGRSGLEDLLDADDFQRGVHPPGVYHLLSSESGTHWSLLPRLAYRDFSIQLMLQDNSDSFDGSAAQGVIVRVRDDEHFYMVLLDSRGGRYAVRKQDGEDNAADLIAWTPSPSIKGRDGENLLRIDAKDENFTIYLNGTLLDSFSDSDYGFGMVGMAIEQGDAERPHLHVDDIQIWSSDTTILSTLPGEKKDPAGDMVLIPGGEFIIGSNERSNERPHIYGLPDFYIDRTEVTNAAYAACVGADQCEAQRSPELGDAP